ncbi:MAG: hypothetical protein K2X86_10070 [Cytophagaceae bacterium]|nr:hypothetical protein [Cytophagaceae bacterium]
MIPDKNAFRFNLTALLFGIWFLLTGWMWVYFINLLLSFPIGILAFFLWKKGKKLAPQSKLNKAALMVLIAGVIASLTSLVILLMFN